VARSRRPAKLGKNEPIASVLANSRYRTMREHSNRQKAKSPSGYALDLLSKRSASNPALQQHLLQAYLLASTIGMLAANSMLISKSRRRSI
jgi:hypothetical protein